MTNQGVSHTISFLRVCKLKPSVGSVLCRRVDVGHVLCCHTPLLSVHMQLVHCRLLKATAVLRRAHGDPFRVINHIPMIKRNFNYSLRWVCNVGVFGWMCKDLQRMEHSYPGINCCLSLALNLKCALCCVRICVQAGDRSRESAAAGAALLCVCAVAGAAGTGKVGLAALSLD